MMYYIIFHYALSIFMGEYSNHLANYIDFHCFLLLTSYIFVTHCVVFGQFLVDLRPLHFSALFSNKIGKVLNLIRKSHFCIKKIIIMTQKCTNYTIPEN